MEVPPSPNLSKQRMIFKSRGSRYRAEINEKEEKGDSTPAAKNVQNGSKMENSESPVTEHESNGLENGVEENSNNSVDLSVDVEIQNEHSGDGDSSVQPEEEDEEHSVSVTFSMPTVTADATGNKNDEEARKSLDSDPGDYVKVENEDSQLSGAGDSILPADTSMLNKEEGEEKENEEKKEEEKEEKEDEKPTVVPAEPRGTVVEETKITKEKGGGVGEWMQKNPQMVVHAAVAATVISVAGLGFYIYARKFK